MKFHSPNLFLSFLIICSCLQLQCTSPSHTSSSLIDSLLKSQPQHFEAILKQPEKYQVQIMFTQIDRDAQQKPHFTTHRYQVNPTQYFYPASTAKFPAAVLALEKLNQLKITGLDKYTPVRFDSVNSPQQTLIKDSSAAAGVPSLAHLIKQIFVVSDNEAYNRIFEFLGQNYIQNAFQQKGYRHSKIVHRLEVGFRKNENLSTSPLAFYKGDDTLYKEAIKTSPAYPPSPLGKIVLGKAYKKDKQLINQPMNFTDYNYISVENLHQFIQAVIFPATVPTKQRFQLNNDDYEFLYKVMSQYPRESAHPRYATQWDSYGKFLFWGNSKKRMPANIRIFNKIGLAYGFLTDTAYFVDFDAGVEFMVTATIFVNKNETFNDNTYEYNQVGFPFLHHLGQVLYQHEKQRSKKHLPDLSRFKLSYD